MKCPSPGGVGDARLPACAPEGVRNYGPAFTGCQSPAPSRGSACMRRRRRRRTVARTPAPAAVKERWKRTSVARSGSGWWPEVESFPRRTKCRQAKPTGGTPRRPAGQPAEKTPCGCQRVKWLSKGISDAASRVRSWGGKWGQTVCEPPRWCCCFGKAGVEEVDAGCAG